MGGKRRSGGLTPDDQALWQAYARTVRPLKRDRVDVAADRSDVPASGKERQGKPSMKGGDGLAATPPSSRKPGGLDHRMRRQVARGRVAIEDRIDLHGMRQAEAHRTLSAFIRSAAARRLGVVLVITGKGRATGEAVPWWEGRDTGVLRRLVPEWLRQADLAPLVVGFEAAGAAHGGDGAFYVRLRRKR